MEHADEGDAGGQLSVGKYPLETECDALLVVVYLVILTRFQSVPVSYSKETVGTCFGYLLSFCGLSSEEICL